MPRLAAAIDWLFPAASLSNVPIAGRHVRQLDAVRGLAILAVTLYRFRGDDTSSGDLIVDKLTRLFTAGSRGVDLFFVLSGFLITGLLLDAKERPHYFFNFYTRRTLRIFPLYYGILFLTFVALPFLGVATNKIFPEATTRQAWLWTYTSNLLISYEGQWSFGAFNHFWSLAVEEHFYLAWPLVIYACSRPLAIRITLGILMLSATTRIAWVMQTENYPASEAFTLFRLDALACGAYLALAARESGGLERFRRAAVVVAIVCLMTAAPLFLARMKLASAVDTIVAVFCACLLVLGLTVTENSLFGAVWKSRSLAFLGKYSYGMYVFQNLLIPLLAPVFSVAILAHATGSPMAGQALYMAGMFAATILIAVASWHGYEKWWLAVRDRLTHNAS